MLFKPEMIQAILAGQKTMTRRLVKEGEELIAWSEEADAVINSKGRLRFRMGQKRAVCPGRGKPRVKYCSNCKTIPFVERYEYCNNCVTKIKEKLKPLFIELVAIKKEKLLDISEEDAKREGFNDREQFFLTFKEINSVRAKKALSLEKKGMYAKDSLWNESDLEFNPDVWVLEFKVIL